MMATPEAVQKMKERFGEDYFSRIGKKGAAKSSGKFKKGEARTKEAGRVGGKRSKRV